MPRRRPRIVLVWRDTPGTVYARTTSARTARGYLTANKRLIAFLAPRGAWARVGCICPAFADGWRRWIDPKAQ